MTSKSGTLFMDSGEVVHEAPVVFVQDESNKKKTVVEKLEETRQKLTEIAERSKLIYTAKAIFPFQFFPDEIVIETDKVTVIHRTLWYKTVHPMPLDYLMSVTVTRGILFAAISFEITGFETNPGDITHLWPGDAAKAKRYIMGLIEAKKENIDLSPVKPSEIRDQVEEIGRSTGDIETLPIS